MALKNVQFFLLRKLYPYLSKIQCSLFLGRGKHYIRKTDRCAITGLIKHSNRLDHAMFQHLQQCEKYLETITFTWFDTDKSHPRL